MFIKRNHTILGGRQYRSVLLVQGKRVPGKRGPGRPRAQAPPPKSVVVHETLANLSKLPAELIELIESYCKEKSAPASAPASDRARAAAEPPSVHVGPCYGLLAALHALAAELGIVRGGGPAKARGAFGAVSGLCASLPSRQPVVGGAVQRGPRGEGGLERRAL